MSTILLTSKMERFVQRLAIKSAFFVIMLGCVFVNKTVAQVSSYSVTQVPTTATFPLSPKTALSPTTGGNVDDAIYALSLPFTFQFNGTGYTSCSVSINGFIYFGTPSSSALTEYNPISSTLDYAGAISVYGRDMDLLPPTAANNVGYTVTGSAPNRIMKIDWLLYRSNGTNTSPDTGLAVRMPMQVWLYETTNVIEMHYNTFAPAATLLQGQIGLRGSSNADYINFNYGNPTASIWPGIAPAPVGSMPVSTPPSGSNAYTVGTRGTTGTILSNSNRCFRWTPPSCSMPTSVAVTNVGITSATIGWNSPGGTPNFNYEIRTSGAAGSGSTGLVASASSSTSSTSVNLNTLSASTTYYLYVQTDCGASGTSPWTTVVSFSTLCSAQSVPYFEYFDQFDDNYTAPVLPPCTAQQNMGTGNNWYTEAADSYSSNYSFVDDHLVYNANLNYNSSGTSIASVGGAQAANTWFFTRGVTLVNGHTYKLHYQYGGSADILSINNKLLVAYGSSPSNAGMTTTLADHNAIRFAMVDGFVNFTFTGTTGAYYFGFKAYSANNMGKLFLDTIEITEPACVEPTGLTVANVTGSSAFVNWTASISAPSNGYAYYLTPSVNVNATAMVAGTLYQIITPGTTVFTSFGAAANTAGTFFTATGPGSGTGVVSPVPSAPSYLQTPTGYTSAGTTLINLTGLAGSTTYYIWVRSYCYQSDLSQWSTMQTFTTLPQPVYCIPASTSSSTYITNVTTTNGIANFANTSGYSTGGYANYTATKIVSQAAGASINFSLTNSDNAGGSGMAIWVDWNNDGAFATSERVYNSAAYIFGGPVNGSFSVPGGQALGDYRMRVVADYTATSPAACTFSGTRGEAEDYTFRVVVAPPPLTLNSYSSVQCAGVTSPTVTITSNLADYNTYSWSPNAGTITGNSAIGYTFNSNSSIVYTLTATQTIAPYGVRSVTYSYTANPLPTPITISPASSPTVCQNGPAVQLSATGGVVSGVSVLSENFNSGAPSWITTNSSSGGNTAAAAWTIVPSPTVVSFVNFSSNDASQFYVSNSDAQGIGSTTTTTLLSPTFSLTGYTAASLSFYHYYHAWINGSATVELFNGASWVTLQSWGANSTQGTATNFALVNIDLTAYAGLSGLQIRFSYTANWGWAWALDNVLVSGNAASAIKWNTQTSPVANGTNVPGLFTNPGATTAYVAGTGASSVYALPSASTTFTATASTPSPVCSVTSSIVVNITPIVAGTASSDQSICNSTAANVVLLGSSGLIQWQSSPDNVTFTNISGATSATLTSAQIGAVTATLYLRAKVSNGICLAYSNVVTITYAATTWTGSAWSNGPPNNGVGVTFNGNYSSTGDLSACSVVVNNGTVTFNSGHTLTVQNAVNVLNTATLTFNNNASLVQVNNNALNTGNITYVRNSSAMRMYDYTYWSSPVTPQTFVALSPNTLSDKYYAFDPVVANWINVSPNAFMTAGKGYIIRAPQNYTATPQVYTGSFYGVPNNGIITTPVLFSTSVQNLIGNPYPSALNADLFLSDPVNTPYIDGTIYLWTHNTPIASNQYSVGDYAMYNYSGGIGTGTAAPGGNNASPNGKIASGNSFFIKALANGNATFKNAMRVVGNNSQFFKNDQIVNPIAVLERSRVWLELLNSDGAYKQTMVGYVENATNGFDRGFDGEFMDAGNPVSFYSLINTKLLGIQGRALPFDENDIVPLGYKTTTPGNYEIRLSDFDGLFANQNVYLVDNLLNIVHDLKQSSYNFVSDVGTFNDRFQLRYTNSTLNVNSSTFNDQSVVVYKNNQNIYINTSNEIMDEVKLFDMRGSLIYAKTKVNASELVISNLVSSQQVILVNIKSFDGKIVTKKLIF